MAGLVYAQEPEMALAREEVRDMAYPRMREQSLAKKRQAIVDEYQKKLAADPRWQELMEASKENAAELAKLQGEILSRRKLDSKTHTINLDEERVEKIPEQAKVAIP
jgi:hypothetical protein